ncbi:hypothetical protein ACT691_12265 [Vibrio metschnikovii]
MKENDTREGIVDAMVAKLMPTLSYLSLLSKSVMQSRHYAS